MHRRRILVVDDYVPAANAVAQLLRLAGHEVVTVYSAEHALPAARELHAQIVLLDLGLQGADDGVTVAERLRRDSNLDRVVIIAVTGRCEAELDERVANAGFDHILVKPVGFDDLDPIISSIEEDHIGGPRGNSIAG